MITAFIGVKGSGKDHRKQQLVAAGAVGLDFKDALLDMASDLAGFDVRESYDYFKETVVGMTAPGTPLHKSMQRQPAHWLTKEILADYPEIMTGRRLLQRLGTDVMRKRNPDYWANLFIERAIVLANEGKDIVCADCRFPNEMETLEAIAETTNTPIKFVFCDYRSPRYDANDPHESEAMAQAYLRLGCKDGDILERKEKI